MKHHWADLLDREGDYWTIVPNRERHAYAIGNVLPGSKETTIVTIGRDEQYWERIFTLPNLEELTLHEPSKEQLASISQLVALKRLRITHARSKSIDFIAPLINLEELILEYISGFSDLSPLRSLPQLRSLHLENIRKVNNFEGLAGIKSIKYLRIDGTIDWSQPILDFEFLRGLPSLEVFSLGSVINKSQFPALLPIITLKNLKKVKMHGSLFPTNEYALMEVGLPNVHGTSWEPYCKYSHSRLPLPNSDIRARLPAEIVKANHPEVRIDYEGERTISDPAFEYYQFLGKSSGQIKCISPNASSKCEQFAEKYRSMKSEAARIIQATNKQAQPGGNQRLFLSPPKTQSRIASGLLTAANDHYFNFKDRLAGCSDEEIWRIADEFIDEQAPKSDKEFLRVVLKNPSVAVAEQFSRKGSPTAQLTFGTALIAGDQVAQDIPHGLFWLRRAHVNGQLRATLMLAAQYLRDGKLSYDPQKAIKYLEVAALGGLPAAQYVLANMLINGEGVRQDEAMGIFYLREAAKRGYQRSIDMLTENDIPLRDNS